MNKIVDGKECSGAENYHKLLTLEDCKQKCLDDNNCKYMDYALFDLKRVDVKQQMVLKNVLVLQ